MINIAPKKKYILIVPLTEVIEKIMYFKMGNLQLDIKHQNDILYQKMIKK
jgi:hypothetical protein